MDNKNIFERYSKQISLSEVGESGQLKFLESKAIIIGCGGLGSIAAGLLAGAGVGSLVLIDGDIIQNSNLHRQIFFSENSKQYKSETLKNHLVKLNSDIEITSINKMVSIENIDELIIGADIVLDCTDNTNSKYLINDRCNHLGITLVYGAIGKTVGYLSIFKNKTKNDINLTDIFPLETTAYNERFSDGVFNTIATLIGVLQANEALKCLLKLESSLSNELLIYDVLNLTQIKMKIKKTITSTCHNKR